MLFELSTALRFLRPSRREMARSLISLLSFGMIVTISWLVIVFYSVTEGLEKRWVNQLIEFTGSIRVVPKPAYFNSYDFLIDTYCKSKEYSLQTLGSHIKQIKDPYSENEEKNLALPPFLKLARSKGNPLKVHELFPLLKKTVYSEVLAVPVTANVEIDRWQRVPYENLPSHKVIKTTQAATLCGFMPWQEPLKNCIKAPNIDDINDLWNNLHGSNLYGSHLHSQNSPLSKKLLTKILENKNHFKWRWRGQIAGLGPQTDSVFSLPYIDFQSSETSLLRVYACNQSMINQLCQKTLNFEEVAEQMPNSPFALATENCSITRLNAFKWDSSGLLWLHVNLRLTDNNHIEVWVNSSFIEPYQWQDKKNDFKFSPLEFMIEEKSGLKTTLGVLCPKIFKSMGLGLGSRIEMSRDIMGPFGPTPLTLDATVIGFYDPGIFPLGGRYIIGPWESAKSLYQPLEENPEENFLQLWPSRANSFKLQLLHELEKKGLDPLFSVSSYDEFPFSRDLILQMQSDKLLLSLIAIIILVVACSSIASMLVLLVNERRREVALFKALGVKTKTIMLCFGLSGSILGLLAASVGIGLGFLTMHYIDSLMGFLSYLYGQEILSIEFYGEHLPKAVSLYAVKLVGLGSFILSTLAGCLASAHSSRLSVANLMRSL